MDRERVVSVRLTAGEYARLRLLGRPSDVLRRLLAADPPPPAVTSPTTTCQRPVCVSWHDGTWGQTYPQLATG
jgi:hypothetical protein